METEIVIGNETPQQAAEGISAALDFLRREAEAAGMSEVGELIGRAWRKARERSACRTPIDAPGLKSAVPPVGRNVRFDPELEHLCAAIAALPVDCRAAFVLKKVYQLSYPEIAKYCGSSINAAKSNVMKSFKLVQAYCDEIRVKGK